MTNPNDWNRGIIDEFRSNAGQLGGAFAGRPVLLLSTMGAKSGQRRTNPVMYLLHGAQLVVFASNGGAATSPDWYHNLVANPTVSVEVGTESYEAQAEVVSGEERDHLYAYQAKIYPQFGEYEKNTTRTIPVVTLTRVS